MHMSSCVDHLRLWDRSFNPIADKDKILQKLEKVAAMLEEDMELSGWTGRTVTLKYKLDTFEGNEMLPLYVAHTV